MKAICIMNLKGGVGKTITAANMAAILARDHGKKVLLVDCDSQCNLTWFVGPEEGCRTLPELLTKPVFPGYESYISWTAMSAGVDILPADASLMALDASQLLAAPGEGRIHARALSDLVDAVREDKACDFVIFDCPPAFNAAAACALRAADEVIIPIKLDAFALLGMDNLLAQIKNMQRINPKLRLAGALITMRTRADGVDAAEQQLRSVQGLPVFQRVIRRSGKVDGSTFDRSPITVFSPKSATGIDYRRFVREYLTQEGLIDG